jgi:predicted membrane-bound spermidine synthase
MHWRLFSFAVGLASCSTIALELLLTRIFSVTMYYHFAYMVISIAMLGLSVSGVSIYLFPNLFRVRRMPILASLFMVGFALLTLWTLKITLANPISLVNWRANIGRLGVLYLGAGLTMLCPGFAISLAIAGARERIGQVYAFDLIGASLGCILVIPAVSAFGGPGAVVASGAVAAVSACLFALSSGGTISRPVRIGAGAVAAAIAVVLLVFATHESDAKRFGAARNSEKFLGNRKVLFEKWNSFSQITVAPAGTADHLWIFIDADAATRLWSADVAKNRQAEPRRYGEVRVSSLVYSLRHERPALIIGPGGGTDVIAALHHGVPKVVGVEVNPIIVNDVVRGQYAEFGGDLYRDPRVEVVVDEGRSYIRRSAEAYGSIQATLVDTWAASSSGAFTLSENNIYTVDAFEEFLGHLAPGGIIAVTRWYDASKPKEFLRLVAIGRAALERRGVRPSEAARHIVLAVDHERHGALLLNRDPYTQEEVQRLADKAAEGQLTLLFAPYPVEAGSNGPVVAEDGVLASYLRAPDSAQYLDRLSFDASPTTDDKPFFFYNLRPGDLLSIAKRLTGIEKDNLGIAVLLFLLALSGVLTLLLVLVPLVVFERKALRKDRRRKLRVLGYFLALGMGFILVEIGFMQKFVLFLGHPIYALAVVLASLLAASGLGSAVSGVGARRYGATGYVRRAIGVLAVVLVVYGLLLGPLFHAMLGLPLGVRVPVAVVLVFIPGLLMGALMPSGVRAANALGTGTVAWGWALNGAASVTGSVLAVTLSMNFGFNLVLAIGGMVYLVGLALFPANASATETPASAPSPG